MGHEKISNHKKFKKGLFGPITELTCPEFLEFSISSGVALAVRLNKASTSLKGNYIGQEDFEYFRKPQSYMLKVGFLKMSKSITLKRFRHPPKHPEL